MKTGIVFSGGGARGAYQVGVWKALNKLGIQADIATGTSIGSINGALYTEGALEKAEELWKKIDFEMVFSEKFDYKSSVDAKNVVSKYLKSVRKGGLEPNMLKENLKLCIDLDKFYNSDIDYGLTTVSFPRLKAIELTKKNIKKDQLIDYIIASATVYPFFKLKEIDEKKYIDGGVRNSIPIDIALELGAERLIVVDISLTKSTIKPKVKPKEVIMIRPQNKIGKVLTFDKYTANRNLKYGYNDAMKKFNKLYGKKYTFRNIMKYYEGNPHFNNLEEFVKTIEFLGQTFKVDDCAIYTIPNYNKKIENAINKMEFKNIQKISKIKDIKDLVDDRERIIFVYYQLVRNNQKSINRIKVVFNRVYKATMYLKENCKINL